MNETSFSSSSNNLKFLQINLRKSGDANLQMVEYVIKNDVDFVLCQDPHLVERKQVKKINHIPSNWNCYLSLNGSSGIVITNPNLIYIHVKSFNNSVFINVTMKNNDNILIGSQYTAPSSNLDQDMKDWTDFFANTNNLIIAGDFNAHLKTWGYRRNDERGEIFMDYIALNDLVILNDPCQLYTLKEGHKKGNPDFTLGGHYIVDHMHYWKVLTDEPSLSDHLYIQFELSLEVMEKRDFRYKTKSSNFGYFNFIFNNYSKNLYESLKSITNVNDLENWMKDFQIIMHFVQDTVFKKKPLRTRVKTSWYTKDLKIQRNKLNALYKRSNKNPGNTMYRFLYNKERASYKKNIRIAKRNSWLNYC